MNATNDIQSTADSRIAELEQQIANIKASRDLQVTIAADEEHRARKAAAERDQWKNRGDNHWETLRSIREIARTSGDLERIVQWVNDAGSGYTATAEATLAETMDRATAAEVKLSEAVKVIEQPFCVLFLDGRNEHGSHVLPSYPRSFEPVGDDIDDQAEAILVEAERLWFAIGEHVWAEFVNVPDQIGDEGRIEFSGYWEFKGINVEMSRVINASILSKLEGSSHAKA
ncbi:hypothetical protein [Rhizobium rhizogenes]|uniref:hypothetical protein n=1 Tax=Rhizobium rhizogenes TaxID=359 RepID=UPI001574D1F3|nr:hypothetical protein [Rhizobium rhizogenes]NTF67918.1 hypothetical protein [Rhizobium rhizogenes]